jgi:hypothetical protein
LSKLSDQTLVLKEKIKKLESKDRKIAEKLKIILSGKGSPASGNLVEDLLDNVSRKFQNLENHNKELEQHLRTTKTFMNNTKFKNFVESKGEEVLQFLGSAEAPTTQEIEA